MKNIRPVYAVPDNILRVGCLDSARIIEQLRLKIKRFEQSHPEVLLDIDYFNFRALRENLVCENLDCIVSYSLGFGEYREVETKKIHKFDSYFAVSSKHPRAAADRLEPGRLKNETLYLLSLAEMKDAESRALSECAAYGFVPREFKYLSSREALMLAVRNNQGIAIGGAEFGKEFRSDIKLFKIDKPVQDQYIILAWRKAGTSDLTREFVASIDSAEDGGESGGSAITE
jgi:DNA-binding transcriptional LysR family regulator